MTENKSSKRIFGIEWNWGTGIASFLIFFLAVFGFFIWWSFQQNVNLVDPNYYNKGVEFDQEVQKIKNSAELIENLRIEQDSEWVSVIFPNISGNINGDVWFYYIADSRLDIRNEIKLNTENKHLQSKDKLLKGGKYQIIIDWKIDSTAFYFKKEIVIE